MSAVEDSIETTAPVRRPVAPLIDRFLEFISSVRFGVTLLCVLVVLSMIGMLVMQQNVNGFDAYYAALTPAEKSVYGKLGIFDIYHSWYFLLSLLVLSLNIVLASIDRFPSAWSYISRPKTWATKGWLLNRKKHLEFDAAPHAETDGIENEIAASFRKAGYKVTTAEKDGARFVFGERGAVNRLGAYVVHVFLLILFLGHFVALLSGFDADVRMTPGQSTDTIQIINIDLDQREKFNAKLPFTMTCTDIQQQLIDPTGEISVTNTMDWRTQLKIDDPSYGTTIADVSLNRPFSYRGYRFFQAQTIPVGNAREITLSLTPQDGSAPVELSIPRNGSTTMSDGTIVAFADFQPDFTFGPDGQPNTRTGEYNNPVAVLNVTKPGQEATRVFAFARKLADNIPVGAPKLGYKWQLKTFEKAPFAHVLSIKYDPYNASFVAWYIGGFGLIGALIFVFFVSHRRVWARIDRDGSKTHVTVAGEANRNQFSFSDKFDRMAEGIRSRLSTAGTV